MNNHKWVGACNCTECGKEITASELQNKIKMQDSIIENLRNGLQQLAAENHALTARIAEYENTNNQNS